MRRLILVLLVCLIPMTVEAQTLAASVVPVVHAYVQQQPPDPADQLVTDKALAYAEWLYIGVSSIATAYGAISASQNGGDSFQVAMTGVASASSGLAAAKLLPKRWQRFTALIVTGGITAYVTGRQVVKDYQAAKAK